MLCCAVSQSDDREKVSTGGSKKLRADMGPSRSGADSPASDQRLSLGTGRVDKRRVPTLESKGQPTPNVGIGSVAAGEVDVQDIIPEYPTQRSNSLLMALHGSGAGGEGGKDEIMPFRREPTLRLASHEHSGNAAPLLKRGSIAFMEGYLAHRGHASDTPTALGGGSDPSRSASPRSHTGGGSRPSTTASPRSPRGKQKRGGSDSPSDGGPKSKEPVTKDNFVLQGWVVRGPDWKWEDQDGGDGKIGTLLEFNETALTAKVLWHNLGRTYSHYRCGRCRDLAIYPRSIVDEQNSTLQRMSTAKDLFAESSQTFICFDWDDTLFPTTYVRDDLNMDWRVPMKNQKMNLKEKELVMRNLDQCAENACTLIDAAAKRGKVVLVTLARHPWVRDSCANFFPKVGELITALNLPVIYAQDGDHQVEYNKSQMTSNADIEKFWSMVKGKAITSELKRFYSQYEGQSWKNVISIGDSDFERLGTQAATRGYMEEAGLLQPERGGKIGKATSDNSPLARQQTMMVKGKVYKVRTKTFKMLDQPTVEELTVELAMLQKWLPLLIKLDNSCDVNLADVEDPATLQRIERTLRGIGGLNST